MTALGRIRTHDTLRSRQVLYQLSYQGSSAVHCIWHQLPKYIHMHLHYAYLSVCMSSLSYSVFECCSLHWKKRPLSNSKLNKGPLSAMKHTSIRTHEEFFWLNYLGGLVPPNGVEPGNKANIWQPKYSDPPPIRTPSAQIKVAPLHPLHKHTLHVRVIPLNATQ